MNEVFLMFCWLFYFYLHSLLAATSAKSFLTRLLSIKSSRIYRIGYNLFSLTGLIALLYMQFTVPSRLLYRSNQTIDIVAISIMVIALSIMVASIRNYNWRSFLGISKENNTLVITGLGRYIRHPLYSGTMLLVVGYFFYMPYSKNILLFGLMWIYLAVGIKYEEKKLVGIYGDKYRNYQRKVKKMIPFIW